MLTSSGLHLLTSSACNSAALARLQAVSAMAQRAEACRLLAVPAARSSCPASVGALFRNIFSVPDRKPADRSTTGKALSADGMAAHKVLDKHYRFILVSDLDWTMVGANVLASHEKAEVADVSAVAAQVDHDDKDNAALLAFNNLWESKFAADSLLVFSTGRSLALYKELKHEVPLRTPDVLVCSVGTEIFFDSPSDGTQQEPDAQWSRLLDQGWNRQAAQEAAASLPQVKAQSESEQRPHKLSYHVSVTGDEGQQVVQELRSKLKDAGVQANVIYSGGVDLDILPEHASKGKGLEFLLKEIASTGGQPEAGVLVNGDSGNDIELFCVPDVRGCMVSNAHPELQKWCNEHASPNIFQASKRCAGGIVEALNHYSLIPQ